MPKVSVFGICAFNADKYRLLVGTNNTVKIKMEILT